MRHSAPADFGVEETLYQARLKRWRPRWRMWTAAALIPAYLFVTYVPLRSERWREDDTLYVMDKNLWNTPLEFHILVDSGAYMHGPGGAKY